MDEYVNNNIKKYHKYKNYICEITILPLIDNIDNIDKNIIDNNINGLYYANRCRINKIINIIDNKEIEKIDDIYYKNAIIEKTRNINLYDTNLIMPDIIYYLSYDRCFYHNFIEETQYLLWKDGFCGTYKIFSENGDYLYTYLIINNDIIKIN